MFEYIEGVLKEGNSEYSVIDINGVGYKIEIPLSTCDALPDKEEVVKLYTHFHVREDNQKLYGFITKSEREVFRKLIGISKIGPKVALNVLSGLSVKDIIYSVQTGDSSRMKSISGIGPKTAQRLVMELKGKLVISGIEIPKTPNKAGAKTKIERSLREDAYTALISLGYNDSQVVNALSRVEQTIEERASVEDWIKMALQVI